MAGGALGLGTNSIEAAGHVALGNKDVNTAVADAAHQTLVDTGDAAIAAISTATGGAVGQFAGRTTGATGALTRFVGQPAAEAMINAGGIGFVSEGLRAGGTTALDGKTWENGIANGVGQVIFDGGKAGLVAVPTSMLTAYLGIKLGGTVKYDKVLVEAIPSRFLPPGIVSVPLTMPAIRSLLPRMAFDFSSQVFPLLASEFMTPREPKAPEIPLPESEERVGRPAPPSPKKKAKDAPEKPEKELEEDLSLRDKTIPTPPPSAPKNTEIQNENPRFQQPAGPRLAPPVAQPQTPNLQTPNLPSAQNPRDIADQTKGNPQRDARRTDRNKPDGAERDPLPNPNSNGTLARSSERSSSTGMEYAEKRESQTVQVERGKIVGRIGEPRTSAKSVRELEGKSQSRRAERGRQAHLRRVNRDLTISEVGEDFQDTTPLSAAAIERPPEHRLESVRLEQAEKASQKRSVENSVAPSANTMGHSLAESVEANRVNQEVLNAEIFEISLVYKDGQLLGAVLAVRDASQQMPQKEVDGVAQVESLEVPQSARLAMLTALVEDAAKIDSQVANSVEIAAANPVEQKISAAEADQVSQYTAAEIQTGVDMPFAVAESVMLAASTAHQENLQQEQVPHQQAVDQTQVTETAFEISLGQETVLSNHIGAQFRAEEKLLQSTPGSVEAAVVEQKINEIIFQDIVASVANPIPEIPSRQEIPRVEQAIEQPATRDVSQAIEVPSVKEEQVPAPPSFIAQIEITPAPQTAAEIQDTLQSIRPEAPAQPVTQENQPLVAVFVAEENRAAAQPAADTEAPAPVFSAAIKELEQELARSRETVPDAVPFIPEILEKAAEQRQEEKPIAIAVHEITAEPQASAVIPASVSGEIQQSIQNAPETVPPVTVKEEPRQSLAEITFATTDDQGQIPLALYQKLYAPQNELFPPFESLADSAREQKREDRGEPPVAQQIAVETSTILAAIEPLTVANKSSSSDEDVNEKRGGERRDKPRSADRTDLEKSERTEFIELKSDPREKIQPRGEAQENEPMELFPLPKGLRERIAEHKETASTNNNRRKRAEQQKQKAAKQNQVEKETTKGRRDLLLRRANALQIQPNFLRGARAIPASKNIA